MDYDLNDFDDLPRWNDHSLANSPAPVVEQGLHELLALVPAEKLVMGLPFYGYEYTGFLGNRPIHSRQLGLYEIFAALRNKSLQWVHHFDNASQSPFVRRGDGIAEQQIWYDDPRSIARKAATARSLGLSFSGCWTGDALDYSTAAPFTPTQYWQALSLR